MSPRNFRRQFLASPLSDLALGEWQPERCGPLNVYAHPDLELTRARHAHRDLLLLGYIFDAESPEQTNADILEALARCESFEAANRATARLGGTYVLIWQAPNALCLVQDASALREVYYSEQSDGLWLASQPALLEEFLTLEPQTAGPAREFFTSPAFAASGSLWVGNETMYRKVHHLRPNHYLDLLAGREIRYWPDEPLVETTAEAASAKAASFLSGFVEAAARRYALSLAVTAGWDSRMLVAASRAVSDDIAYFVINHDHPRRTLDVRIAERLVRRLGLSLDIRTYSPDVDPDYEAAFRRSITLGRSALVPMYYHVFVVREQAHMSINGNVSEVARNYFEREKRVTPEKLSFLIYGAEPPFAVDAYARWLDEATPLCARHGYDIMDLFYWEERLGNWCAKARTELHLATEVFSPFNCRELLALLLSVDERHRDKYDNVLYRRTIERMWPEALGVPFNPKLKHRLIRGMQRTGVYAAYLSLKRAAVKLVSPLKSRRRRD